jgi:hypothetical protein
MPTNYGAMIKDIHRQNKNVTTQAQMHKEWNKLRLEVVKRIDEIDKKTPSDGYLIISPKWWEDMMEIRRNLSKDI